MARLRPAHKGETMIRRVGETVKNGQRYTLRPGAYAIVQHGSEILLTHQMEPEPEFQLPGGGIDPGEHPIAALHREILEETGWRVQVLLRLGAFRRFTYMPEYDLWAEKVCTIYLARSALRHGPPQEPGHTAHIVPLSTAIEIVGNEGDRMFLSQLLG